MASVGSLTSSTSNSIRGYGGLASGLDRDELIEGMTIGTRTKINQQEQKKQKIEWMQEAVRTISDKMISFHGKYTETLTSPSNLFSAALWGRNKITTSGENSKYVSISGSASTADAITIMGVKQRAQKAAVSSTRTISDGKLSGGAFNKTTDINANEIKLKFKVGDEEVNIELNGFDKDVDESKIQQAIQDKLNDTLVRTTGEKLSKYITADFETDSRKFSFKAVEQTPATGEEAKSVSFVGGSALRYLGLEGKGGIELTGEGVSGEIAEKSELTTTFEDKIFGKTLTFSYNGTDATITLPTAGQIEEESKLPANADKDQETLIKESIQKQLNAAFGKDRISVDFKADGKGLEFTTKVPGGDVDNSSILKLTGGDSSAVEALGLKVGVSSRKDLDTTLLSSIIDKNSLTSTNGKYEFVINNQTISIDENATVRDLMNKINDKNSGLGVTVSYQEATDKFTFTSTENGASGTVTIGEASAKAINDIFKIDMTQAEGVAAIQDVDGKITGYEKRGDDAIIGVRYAGSDDVVELRRDSNTFTIDGLTISVKGAFGYDETHNRWEAVNDATKAVEVDASVDVDKLMSTIKSFVEDYNAIVDMVNGELTTKHDNDYDPLSSEQKSELSESEIEKWEAKAKAGLLYGDSDLRNLSMDLRTVATSYVWQLEEVGISLSSNYSDNGKMSIDETKLRAALTTNPEKVEKLFTATAGGVDADGKPIYNGVATNLKNVMNKYVKTTGPMEEKGILIRKAGSQSAAMSLTENYYYDQITSIEKLLDTLNDRLKTEQDRYISQFSSLETLINNMNSQSSYLSSMF